MNRAELQLADLIEYVREHGDGVVSTIGPDGAPQAAYLTVAVTDRGELVFDARTDSRKVANIRTRPRIAVVIGGRDGTTLQCQGRADAPGGSERERCAAAYVAAFPQFAESVRDPGVVVVRVTLDWARFGDFRDGGHDTSIVELTRPA